MTKWSHRCVRKCRELWKEDFYLQYWHDHPWFGEHFDFCGQEVSKARNKKFNYLTHVKYQQCYDIIINRDIGYTSESRPITAKVKLGYFPAKGRMLRGRHRLSFQINKWKCSHSMLIFNWRHWHGILELKHLFVIDFNNQPTVNWSTSNLTYRVKIK